MYALAAGAADAGIVAGTFGAGFVSATVVVTGAVEVVASAALVGYMVNANSLAQAHITPRYGR